jgi:hypothetical protein
VLAAVVAALGGCHRGGERARTAGSALWTDAGAPPPTVGDLAALEQAGVSELFVDAAAVEWQGGQPRLQAQPLARVARRTRAMLVLRGDWPLDAVDESAAKALVSGLEPIARQAEEAGLVVAGWHLDLRGEPREPGIKLLTAVRAALEPSLLLAVTVQREAIGGEGLDALRKSTDFLVAFVYGQREGEPDDPAAWDFQKVKTAAQQLDGLDEPFLLGIVVRGAATVVRGGADVGDIPGATLADLAWNKAMRLAHGFSLEGVDRQVYAFTADYPTRVGGTALVPGDDVRVVSTSTAHLQELRKERADWKLHHCLGELYYRLPHPEERLSLGLESLSRVASGARSLPDPRLTVEKIGGSTGRVVFRVTLDNPSPEASDIGGVDSNFVELQAVGGAFIDVKPGAFFRYDLLAPGADGRLVRSNYPVIVRLYAPVLAAGAHLESGSIEVRTVPAGLGDLVGRASFLAPYGGSAETPPLSWTKLGPAPAATPTAGATPAIGKR